MILRIILYAASGDALVAAVWVVLKKLDDQRAEAALVLILTLAFAGLLYWAKHV
jgi:hypothetical protein